MEYITASGAVITDEMIEAWGKACERGEYPGMPGKFIISPVGRPRLSDDELVSVSFKLPRGVVNVLDATAKKRNESRSEFLREAVGNAISAAH
ncbi:MAG TPA: hypothetical protein DEQ14_02955 [Treponema sp.]|nr:hypothetical protein [Treponema sp.]